MCTWLRHDSWKYVISWWIRIQCAIRVPTLWSRGNSSEEIRTWNEITANLRHFVQVPTISYLIWNWNRNFRIKPLNFFFNSTLEFRACIVGLFGIDSDRNPFHYSCSDIHSHFLARLDVLTVSDFACASKEDYSSACCA